MSPVAAARNASVPSTGSERAKASAAAVAAPRTSARSIVLRRPMASASAPPSGPATVTPMPYSATMRPASIAVQAALADEVRARKAATKVATRFTSSPAQSVQNAPGRPPVAARSLARMPVDAR